MKQILLDRYGQPEDSLRCADVPDVGAPGAGEVVYDVIAFSDGIDIQQGAMLRINPATALLLLTDVVPLKPGDWIIQNVANSAVGRLVIRLARPRGVKTVNVVRRESLFGELKALGGDVCVVD